MCTVDAEKIEFLKQKKILVNVDGAQSFSKVPIDVGSMRIDILHSSGHKTFAPQGTGVVYLNETVFGRRGTDFELGTLHYAGILALGMAVSFMQDIGMTHIDRILEQSTQYLYESMRSTPGIEFTKGVAGCSCKSGSGTISFNLINIAPVEIGQFMNYHSVCVRTGSHCNFLSDASIHSVRVSLHVYTNKADIDKFHSLLATLAHGL
jgi:cysteine desulfurase/selenocysteine lyase